MTGFERSIGQRIGSMAVLFLVLTGAATAVNPVPQTMVPASTDHPIGEEFTARKGDVVMRAKVVETESADLTVPVSVTIGKFEETFPAGTKLRAATAAEAAEKLFGIAGNFYCGESRAARPAVIDMAIVRWLSKYDKDVRFCFFDSDADNKFDKVVLAGTKNKEEQRAVSIEPADYRKHAAPEDTSVGSIELRVAKISKNNGKVSLNVMFELGDKLQGYSYLITKRDGEDRYTYWEEKTDPKKAPYPTKLRILGGEIEIVRVDPANEEMAVRIIKDFDQQTFRPYTIEQRPTYYFISY